MTLSWEGKAEVYPPGQVLKIAVRSSIDRDGKVVSESWPVDLGEAKGLRRMTLSSTGGTIERGGQAQPMPKEMWDEERAQFGFYQQLQVAAEQLPRHLAEGVNLFSVPGPVATWFRIGPDGQLSGAVNEVPAEGGRAWQEFRFDGLLNSNGAVFPGQLRMTRNGERYFLLEVTKFDAR
ncbi:hypothetical protein LZ518_05000 [Sphingomonas sp. RB56-2]|uniref:Uncharacterized protein n=1 Tax=Sphingomonas brevis TaxID=2908206 RepID=A0ABT0S842_9SPHN|nr:hypothetical protein [Sphingomonas brevis]MCL6740487.1 hypothetical protein [Sphingomonas brevis]